MTHKSPKPKIRAARFEIAFQISTALTAERQPKPHNYYYIIINSTMLRFAPRVATRAAVAFQSSHVPVGVAATQALTARWMSAAAPGPKVC